MQSFPCNAFLTCKNMATFLCSCKWFAASVAADMFRSSGARGAPLPVRTPTLFLFATCFFALLLFAVVAFSRHLRVAWRDANNIN